jgi:hypothetical protein
MRHIQFRSKEETYRRGTREMNIKIYINRTGIGYCFGCGTLTMKVYTTPCQTKNCRFKNIEQDTFIWSDGRKINNAGLYNQFPLEHSC